MSLRRKNPTVCFSAKKSSRFPSEDIFVLRSRIFPKKSWPRFSHSRISKHQRMVSYVTIVNRLLPGTLKKKLIYVLDGRKEEDVFETHYKANTARRISALARLTGFEAVKIKMLVTSAAFALVLPVAVAELIWIRLLMTRPFKPLRTNIIAILRKQ